MTPNVFMEAWLRMITEGARGSTDALDTMKLMTTTPTSPDDMLRLMRRFMPTGTSLPMTPDGLTSTMEEYWGMLGVVPRYRYLEVLERNEQLRRRLDEAERKLNQMRQLSGAREQTTEEAQKMFTLWSSMMAETVRMQNEWVRSVSSLGKGASETETAASLEAADHPEPTSPSNT
ncbi:MAG: hypothetical protein HC911_00960 [Chloroflexaceae bacterium]|nr:hypothetical protein [Chloroflexaceae bacterium]